MTEPETFSVSGAAPTRVQDPTPDPEPDLEEPDDPGEESFTL